MPREDPGAGPLETQGHPCRPFHGLGVEVKSGCLPLTLTQKEESSSCSGTQSLPGCGSADLPRFTLPCPLKCPGPSEPTDVSCCPFRHPLPIPRGPV